VADYVIDAQPRTVTGKKVGQLRNEGMVPAVVYGPSTPAFQIQIPYRPLEVMLMKAGGTHLIDIQVNGKTHTVLTREVQRHILRGSILHVDFFAVDADQTISADVFIQYVGESPAVDSGNMLMTGPSSLTVETLPADLPSEIIVDVSGLVEIGDSIHVRDLNLGEGVVIHNDPDELIVRVVQPSAARMEEDLVEEAAEETVAEEVEDEEDED
jgi:large subunit ribosomal protein L25